MIDQLLLYGVKLAKPKNKYQNKDLPLFGDCRSHRRDPSEGEADFNEVVARHWRTPPALEHDDERVADQVTYRYLDSLTCGPDIKRATVGALFIRGETGINSDIAFSDGREEPRSGDDREDFTLGAVCHFPADGHMGFMGVHAVGGKTAYRLAKSGLVRAAREIGLRIDVRPVTAPERVLRAVEDDRVMQFELVHAKPSGSVRGFGPAKNVAVSRSHRYVARGGYLRVPENLKAYFLGKSDDGVSVDGQSDIAGAVVRVELDDGTPRTFTVGSVDQGRPIGEVLELREKASDTPYYVRSLDVALGKLMTPVI
ncbi:MAG: hypothetical protein AAFP84_20870 [Actinomycetota bacterium]